MRCFTVYKQATVCPGGPGAPSLPDQSRPAPPRAKIMAAAGAGAAPRTAKDANELIATPAPITCSNHLIQSPAPITCSNP